MFYVCTRGSELTIQYKNTKIPKRASQKKEKAHALDSVGKKHCVRTVDKERNINFNFESLFAGSSRSILLRNISVLFFENRLIIVIILFSNGEYSTIHGRV